MIKLLVVDDEAGIREVLMEFLASKGYTVFQAEDGKKALSIISKEKPSLVFLDVIMPGMDGLEVLKRIKKQDKSIKVIMVTVDDSPRSIARAKELGADEYITKPFSINYLEDVVIKKIS